MSLLNEVTQDIRERNVQDKADALVNKWEQMGLLEGIGNADKKRDVAILLQNQAADLHQKTRKVMNESSTMAGGDVEGFASVAFPIVRRIYGDMIAEDLISVQPMSLPSGLIFFLDFQYDRDRLGQEAGDTIYGGGRVGSEITGGIDLTGENAEEGPFHLNQGYTSPTASSDGFSITSVLTGTVDGTDEELMSLVQYDPDLSGSDVAVGTLSISDLEANAGGPDTARFNKDNLVALQLDKDQLGSGARQVRRRTQYSGSSRDDLLVILEAVGGTSLSALETTLTSITAASYTMADNFEDSDALGAVIGDPLWGLEDEERIPELDIQIDSVSVTARTKKLKATWTPELGQDLNAYHNLDAEVELTSQLSETVELEINHEILEDLVKQAKAGTLYWSRRPGKFVQREEGTSLGNLTTPPDFTGNVSEWYETLLETVNEISARIERKVGRGGATFMVCGPEVANILEMTSGFRANVSPDDDTGEAGVVNVGKINHKFDVYVDRHFFRNVILVGRKGSGFLETGYVYAPYVPLQITPTIFDPESFVPRKGVMTRYAKKMVRPDYYGLVIVEDLIG